MKESEAATHGRRAVILDRLRQDGERPVLQPELVGESADLRAEIVALLLGHRALVMLSRA